MGKPQPSQVHPMLDALQEAILWRLRFAIEDAGRYRSVGPRAQLEDAAELVKSDRPREALERFAVAAEIISRLPQQSVLADLLQKTAWTWGTTAALYALASGFLVNRLEPADYGVTQFLAAKRFALKVGLPQAADDLTEQVSTGGIGALVAKSRSHGLAKEEKEAVEEFNTTVRLLAAEDPFEGWEALAKEVTKRWPAGVSVEAAMREERGGYEA